MDEIKREDFTEPMRQDKYGTSVISIQFTRGDINTLSIKLFDQRKAPKA